MAATIFALSTGPAISAIAVIRISGSKAVDALQSLTRRPPPPIRHASLRLLLDPEGNVLDEALVLFFPGPNSFTGEDVVELQCHGSRAVVRAVLEQLGSLPGLELAEPGAFTQRAFEHGRLDLTEVEALSDLLVAETKAQLDQAQRNLGGGLRMRAERWRQCLLEALAFVEATIDWADEEVPEDVASEVLPRIEEAAAGMAKALVGSTYAERVREGFQVALVGAPNVGKSSIINALAGREVALATPIAGTTRDVIELRLDVEGIPVTLLDMAGLRSEADEVEMLGVARAQERAMAADLRVFVDAPGIPLPEELRALWREGDRLVSNKADHRPGPHAPISALTGQGIDSLLREIGSSLRSRDLADGTVSNQRQVAEIRSSLEAATRARADYDALGSEELAEYLRDALRSLERLAGRTDSEAVLSAVFGKFCLGK